MQGNYVANEAGLLTYSSKFTDVRAKVHEHLEKWMPIKNVDVNVTTLINR